MAQRRGWAWWGLCWCWHRLLIAVARRHVEQQRHCVWRRCRCPRCHHVRRRCVCASCRRAHAFDRLGSTASLSVLRSTLRGNTAFSGGSLALGDAVSAVVSVLTIRDSTAAFGGGVAVEHAASLSVASTVVRDNVATVDGGGVHVADGAKVTCNRTSFAYVVRLCSGLRVRDRVQLIDV